MRTILLLLLMYFSINILPQEDKKFTIGETVTIKSQILGEDREIFISVPANYAQGNLKYPVFYVLDGNAHFHYGSGIANYYTHFGTIPQMIVVGIPNTNRNRDFTPTNDPNVPESGGGNNFISFLEKELIPFVDRNYRTTPYKLLFGHSLTGLFGIYTMVTHPDLFNAYITASPYIMYDNNYVLDLVKNQLPDSFNEERYLYLTIGNEPDYFPMLDELEGTFKSRGAGNFKWSYTKHMGDNHASIPIKTIDAGLLALFSDWQLPQNFGQTGTLEGLKDHYSLISKKYYNDKKVPEGTANILGYQMMGAGRLDEALKVFEYNIEQYPGSANVYDSYGEALEAANKPELAKENYEKAVKIGKQQNDPNVGIFAQHLEAVKEKISSASIKE